MRNLLGGKGANLHEMASLGLPVPPGFTITTEVCTYFYAKGKTYPPDLAAQVDAAVAEVERLTGRVFGDAANPLLLSVRSGARASMPGMMDTVLNLGLNDASVETVAKSSGDERFAFDSYRRFIQMYSHVVLEVDDHEFEDILEHYKDSKGYSLDTDLNAKDWRAVIVDYKAKVAEATGKPFPTEPKDQLSGSIGAVFSSWMNQPARDHLSKAQQHPRGLGNRRQRPGDGVRQHGRDIGDRRRLHPQSVDRRERALRRVSRQRPG
jgi:pyruvate,orthophosphate dikinase